MYLPRTSPRLWFFTLAAGLTLAAIATPALLHFNFVLAAFAIRTFYSVACHQDPVRSWWFWGTPVAICYRCLGIYSGAAAGTWWRADRATLIRSTMIFALTFKPIYVELSPGYADPVNTPQSYLSPIDVATYGQELAGFAGP